MKLNFQLKIITYKFKAQYTYSIFFLIFFTAKKAAAEALLSLMGYSKPQPQPVKPSIKSSGSTNGADSKESSGDNKRKVTFVEVDTGNETSHSHPQGGTKGFTTLFIYFFEMSEYD